MSREVELKDVNSRYVKVLCNYHYIYKGEDVSMAKDEVFLLLKKATDDWWQVIRDGETKAFFAPRRYLEIIDLGTESIKSSLRKKKIHQRQLQHQQRSHEEQRKLLSPEDERMLPQEKEKSREGFSHLVEEQEIFCNEVNLTLEVQHQKEAPVNPLWRKNEKVLDANKNEAPISSGPSYPENYLVYQKLGYRRMMDTEPIENAFDLNISVTSGEKMAHHRCSTSNGTTVCSEKLSTSSDLDFSSSSHTSVSSLNNDIKGSIDSFSGVRMNCHMVGKAASFDVLQAEDEDSLSALERKYVKAVSSDELDRGALKGDYLFYSNHLSQRYRSNSVELRRFENNLDLSESERILSLDKNRKCRITRDPMNRRRSWALNERNDMSYFHRSKSDEPDVSVILDIPPELPPKLSKSKNSQLSKSTDNLQLLAAAGNSEDQNTGIVHSAHIENSVLDGKTKFPQEFDNFVDSQKEYVKDRKPVALPRKILPYPQNEIISEELTDYGKLQNSTFKSEVNSSSEGIETISEPEHCNYTTKERQEDVSSKESSVEELIERMENRVKSTEVKAKLIQAPPSPAAPPRRIVFDNWGEYIDSVSGRPYYYNTNTKDKRWKPPRKSICSLSNSKVSESSLTATKNIPGKAVKIPVPPQVPAWSYRERSFTSLGTPAAPVACPSTRLVPTASVSSSTLPNNSQHTAGLIPKGSQTLPSQPSSPGRETMGGSPTPKSSKSFFSSISSFMKHSSGNSSSSSLNISSSPISASHMTPPQVPPSSTKPAYSSASSPILQSKGVHEEELVGLQSAIEQFCVPKGWIRKYDALSQQIYFQSLVTGEKWNPAIDKSGTVYVYSPSTGESKWNLQEYESYTPASTNTTTDSRTKFLQEEAIKEDVFMWRFNMRNGKKAKKVWSKSYVHYYPNAKRALFGRTYGYLTFSKKPNEFKHWLKGPFMNRQFAQTGLDHEWQDKVLEKNLSSDKDKRVNKGSDKGAIAKKDSVEEVDSTKGIKDTLILFFKRRIQQETLTKRGIYKDTVFGSTIGDLCQKEQLNIPMFVLQCIKNIEKDEENFKVDGLYRISGNASKIQKIRIEIAQNRYLILEEEKDVHNLTGALKLFFRELKEPLIPFAHYKSFIQATCSEFLKNKSRDEALRQAIKKIPNCNRETLKLLLRHLLKVSEYEHENRMSIMNLAIVFGPCLTWPETTSGYDLMTDAMLHNRVVEALLSDFEDVFKCSR